MGWYREKDVCQSLVIKNEPDYQMLQTAVINDQLEIAKLLLEDEATDSFKIETSSLLVDAVRYNHPLMVNLLLQDGRVAKVDTNMALIQAIKDNNPNIASLILLGGKNDLERRFYQLGRKTIVEYAEETKNSEIIELFLDV